MSDDSTLENKLRLIVFDPGHFHAALLQKQMYANLDPQVSVYAPLGSELLDYLSRISAFNNRAENPTRWDLDIHCSAQPLHEMLDNPAGSVAVFSGKNRTKISHISASVAAGFHVLADKPWIISFADMSSLEQVLASAAAYRVVAYDIMTERFEVTSQLARELVNTPAVFGDLEAGRPDSPAIYASSVHHLMKIVSGVPLRRPAWFFDIEEYGEGLADVGTHVIDLVQWTAFPDQTIDYRKDLRVFEGRRWPQKITREQFHTVTGARDFAPSLRPNIRGDELHYFCNNSVHYTIKGAHVKLELSWEWQAAEGTGDKYEAVFRGSRASVQLRQGPAEKYVPEIYVVPSKPNLHASVMDALREKIRSLQGRWPGMGLEENATEARVVIPPEFRVGHEAHFGQVAHRFFEYLRSPASLPEWEKSYMLAKYYVSTKGVELARLG